MKIHTADVTFNKIVIYLYMYSIYTGIHITNICIQDETNIPKICNKRKTFLPTPAILGDIFLDLYTNIYGIIRKLSTVIVITRDQNV